MMILLFLNLLWGTLLTKSTVVRGLSSNWCYCSMDCHLGDNRIQNVHLGRCIVGYMVGNFVLRRCVSRAVKRNFRTYNSRYTAPNEHFEYGYHHSNTLFNIYSSKAQHFAPNWSFVSNVKQLHRPTDLTYDVGAPTVYRRIYWRKFLTLSNQMSRYIHKCIRMLFCVSVCVFLYL